MKNLFLSAAFVFLAGVSHATHTLWYYVYFQTEFVQGPWTGTDILSQGYMYLEPKLFVIENAGSDPVIVPAEALDKLRENAPKLYGWDYKLEAAGDTLLISSVQAISDFGQVKNEVITTMTHLGFPLVRFKTADLDQVFSQQDVDLPFFELVGKQNPPPVAPSLPADTAHAAAGILQPAPAETPHHHWPDWLVYGLSGLNAVLIAWLILGRTRKTRRQSS